MNERIKILREKLGLSQKEFAEKIGYKQHGISMIELGHNRVNDKIIALICAKYNVNEQWLRNNDGEIFNDGIVFLDEKEKIALMQFNQLNEQCQDYVLLQMKELLKIQKINIKKK
jgi:transcriptional regulator with XRE-family HTH domain